MWASLLSHPASLRPFPYSHSLAVSMRTPSVCGWTQCRNWGNRICFWDLHQLSLTHPTDLQGHQKHIGAVLSVCLLPFCYQENVSWMSSPSVVNNSDTERLQGTSPVSVCTWAWWKASGHRMGADTVGRGASTSHHQSGALRTLCSSLTFLSMNCEFWELVEKIEPAPNLVGWNEERCKIVYSVQRGRYRKMRLLKTWRDASWILLFWSLSGFIGRVMVMVRA